MGCKSNTKKTNIGHKEGSIVESNKIQESAESHTAKGK